MKIFARQYVIKKCDELSSEYIETHISGSGFEPLRWAIVKVDKDQYIVDAVVIKN